MFLVYRYTNSIGYPALGYSEYKPLREIKSCSVKQNHCQVYRTRGPIGEVLYNCLKRCRAVKSFKVCLIILFRVLLWLATMTDFDLKRTFSHHSCTRSSTKYSKVDLRFNNLNSNTPTLDVYYPY